MGGEFRLNHIPFDLVAAGRMGKKFRSNHLPFDLIAAQILPRLPVKSLVRFTAVCKTWHSLIKSPQFLATHLNLHRSEDKGQYPLIIDRFSCFVVKNQKPILVAELDYTSALLPTSHVSYAKSCNGLILLEYYVDSKVRISLWNPSIRKYKRICTHGFVERIFHVYGLGFHETSNDHRLVRIVYVGSLSGDSTKVEVYSVRTDSWHRVDSSPGRLLCFGAVYLYGCIHWLATRLFDDHNSIILFDIENECFREMELPKEVNILGYDNLEAFREYNGSLATVYYDKTDNECYVWHMTRYGVSESWAKIFTISLSVPVSCSVHIGLTKSGMLVYEDFDNPSTVDCEKGSSCYRFMDIQKNESNCVEGFGECIKVVDYMESLALL